MSSYNLTDTQKDLLRRLVGSSRSGELRKDFFVHELQDPREYDAFICRIELRSGDRIEFESRGDLDWLSDTDPPLIHRRNKIYSITQAGFDAVDYDFEAPPTANGTPPFAASADKDRMRTQPDIAMRQLIDDLNKLTEQSKGLGAFSEYLQSEGVEWFEADESYVQELMSWESAVKSILALANQDEYSEIWQKAMEPEITVANVRGYAETLRILLRQIVSRLKRQYNQPPDLEVSEIPFLSDSDVSAAYKMAELYVILHCYENSVRRFIEETLSESFGEDWWEEVASDSMKRYVKSRREKEENQRWLSPRGNTSPLYYLEWGDLVKLIRKEQAPFLPLIGNLRFVENRFEELENLRNIVAHNGVLPSEDDFQRVFISFRDWCRQLGTRE